MRAAYSLAVLEQFRHAVADCGSITEVQEAALRGLSKALESCSGMYLLRQAKFEASDWELQISENVELRFFKDYRDYYCHLDPIDSGIAAPTLDRRRIVVASLRQFVDYRKFVRSEFYNDFYRPQGIHHVLAICIKLNEHSIARIGLHRSREGGQFSHADIMFANIAAGMIAARIVEIENSGRLLEREALVTCLLEESICEGIVVVDGTGSIIRMNERARRMLRDFSDEVPRDLFRNPNFIESARNSVPNCKKPKCLDISTCSPKWIRIKPCPLALPDEKQPLYVFRLEINDLEMTGRIGASLGLTAREIQVVNKLEEGMSNAEIACRLSISVITVQNHLRSIYAKACVHSRTRLLSRIAQLRRNPSTKWH